MDTGVGRLKEEGPREGGECYPQIKSKGKKGSKFGQITRYTPGGGEGARNRKRENG